MCSLHLRGGMALRSLSLMVEYVHKLYVFPLYRDFSIPPHLLFTLSFIYISLDTWAFIIYFGLYFNTTLFTVVLKLFGLHPLGTLSLGSYIPLTYIHHCAF